MVTETVAFPQSLQLVTIYYPTQVCAALAAHAVIAASATRARTSDDVAILALPLVYMMYFRAPWKESAGEMPQYPALQRHEQRTRHCSSIVAHTRTYRAINVTGLWLLVK